MKVPAFAGMTLVILFCSLSGCTITPPEIRAQHAAHLAASKNWQEQTINTKSFVLKAFGPAAQKYTQVLTIYIEGDGLAWISRDRISDNPTPMVFTGLKMALNDDSHYPAVYLARPCQLVFNQDQKNCESADWTNARFSEHIINSMNQAANHLKHLYHAQKIILIGYSGGGTIATLLAARRHDIAKLITVAAVLDTQEWTKQENLTPLTGSLNPADFWQNLISVNQTHYVGAEDKVVPKEVAFAYANHFPTTQKPKIIIVSGFDHRCCWNSLHLN